MKFVQLTVVKNTHTAFGKTVKYLF